MANLAQMMQELKAERKHMTKELRGLDKAISAVGKLLASNSTSAQGEKPKVRRRLSAAARKRIADAQRARWAKLKKQKAA
ncbi:MAG TPA: hypothetical protein VNJ12_06055 [Candidatus Dormibacteraeota bacterium]|nr:hypothetical protein [Candidatus Dormibacteraeota bacterium]